MGKVRGSSSSNFNYEFDSAAAMKQVEREAKKWKKIDEQVNKPIDFGDGRDGRSYFEDRKPNRGREGSDSGCSVKPMWGSKKGVNVKCKF